MTGAVVLPLVLPPPEELLPEELLPDELLLEDELPEEELPDEPLDEFPAPPLVALVLAGLDPPPHALRIESTNVAAAMRESANLSLLSMIIQVFLMTWSAGRCQDGWAAHFGSFPVPQK